MYSKICKWCNENIVVDKQQHFASHVSGCIKNPRSRNNPMKGVNIVERITFNKVCSKCGNDFEITATESEVRRNKVRKYCSSKCSQAREWTEEKIIKLKETMSISEKVKLANKIIGENRKDKNHKEYRFTCLHCKEIGYDNNWNKNRKYHKECWLKISGGLRKGSSRGKSGWYQGYWCDSSYELAFLIYCLENKKKIERNSKGFEYVYQEEPHKFYPDFIVDNEYVEIKNYRSELTDSKISHFPYKITIYYKDTIKPFLEYTINKYGKDFIKLYKETEMTTTTQQQPQQQITRTD